MNNIINNLYSLNVKMISYAEASKDQSLIPQLRKLTLYPRSGMNYELNRFEVISEYREINASIILSYYQQKLVGWALYSKEPTDFLFPKHDEYSPNGSVLFEVFVCPEYRKMGIGSEMIKIAKKKAFPEKLSVSAWDNKSIKFYNRFDKWELNKL